MTCDEVTTKMAKRRRMVAAIGFVVLVYCFLELLDINLLDDIKEKSSSVWIWNRQAHSIMSSEDMLKHDWIQKRENLLAFGGRKKVMLFCYMRGGSTFFSELFRQNRDVMYWYEPFDAFYSAEFGEKTWHFPQDIFWYQHSPGNSSLRQQPEWELDDMATFNHNILSCNFSALPVELLYHHGLVKTNLVNFRSCALRQSLHKEPSACRRNIARCTGNTKQVFEYKCPQNIKIARRSLLRQAHSVNNDTVILDKAFLNHAQCNHLFYKSSRKCLNILEGNCNNSKIVTYKGLRVTMTSVERMLNMDPDLYVIYFVRDPRATVTSRVKIAHTYRDTENSPILEAKFHCQKMMRDISVYNRVKERYPGAILLAKYEDVAANPQEQVEQIYGFFGMAVHETVYMWIKKNSQITESINVFSTKRANQTESIDRWRKQHDNITISQMTRHCKEVLLALNYTL